MPEINEAFIPYSSKEVVGEERNRVSDYTNAFIEKNRRIFDRVVYLKAIRRVSGYLNINVGDKEVSALGMVLVWNWQNKRSDGGPLDSIVGWSGYMPGWKRWINWGISACLDLGLLENRQVQRGQRVCITEKGMSVLRALDEMSEKVIQEMDVNVHRVKPVRYIKKKDRETQVMGI